MLIKEWIRYRRDFGRMAEWTYPLYYMEEGDFFIMDVEGVFELVVINDLYSFDHYFEGMGEFSNDQFNQLMERVHAGI